MGSPSEHAIANGRAASCSAVSADAAAHGGAVCHQLSAPDASGRRAEWRQVSAVPADLRVHDRVVGANGPNVLTYVRCLPKYRDRASCSARRSLARPDLGSSSPLRNTILPFSTATSSSIKIEIRTWLIVMLIVSYCQSRERLLTWRSPFSLLTMMTGGQ